MSKKYMIRCDIEGVTGVVNYNQAEPGKPGYEYGKSMLMSDLISVVNGLNDGGADEIWIYDEHCDGNNVDLTVLPDNVRCICGKPPYTSDWAGGLDKSFSGLILLGFHSKRGTEDALLNHTYEPDIRDIDINGVSVGEIGMEAAVAGSYGVPLVLITGDSEGVREAKELVKDVEAITVKESLSEFGAVCYPTSLTTKNLYNAARKIAEEGSLAKPYETGKTKLTFTLRDGRFFEIYNDLYKTENNKTVIEGENALAAYSEYWRRKLECQNRMGE